ncbi:MAG: hypothetical protein Q7S46_09140 [Gallionella sp.]|nr:hypothetical protein [Gallionella sp.]
MKKSAQKIVRRTRGRDTSATDRIAGLAGNDTLIGGAGNETCLYREAANDTRYENERKVA